MGGIRKFKNRNKKRSHNGGDSSQRDNDRAPYVELVRENALFEKYYKAQNVVPETEWDAFLDTLRRDLPAAFRITACNEKEAAALLEIVEGNFFNDLINPDDPEEQKKKPICLPWYPKRLGWQVPISRKDIRRSETYFKLHNFLMSETESGNISRQEVVSMIPPLVLDVQPHHKVLDMCAAPGSKTAQLIEMMHCQDKLPSGLVVANDVDNSRCYMLVHQAKRLNSCCTIITNHDASIMPNFIINNPDGTAGVMKYDRILCDVPCTGDGTLRKNADIWKKWNPSNGNNLHGVQMRIVKRAAEMLSVGGRMVYSTCSLNPLENEAVMHRMLVESEGAMELQDVSQSLPGLAYIPGITTWKLGSKECELFSKFEDVPETLHNQIRPQMFPPKAEDVGKFNLNRCVRILPQQQDTGGFFVAVLKKLGLLPWESSKSESQPSVEVNGNTTETRKSNGPQSKRRRIQGYREDPFVFFKEEEPVWPLIKNFYDISPDLPLDCLLTRCNVGKKKNIYFVSPKVRDIIDKNQDNIKLINAGVKAFARCDNKNTETCFRLAQEGIQNIAPYIGKSRKVPVTKADLLKLLSNEDPTQPPEIHTLDITTQEKLQNVSHGSCVLEYAGDGLQMVLVGWKGTCSLRAYVQRSDAIHYLRLLGGDTSIFEKNKFKKDDITEPMEGVDIKEEIKEEVPLKTEDAASVQEA